MPHPNLSTRNFWVRLCLTQITDLKEMVRRKDSDVDELVRLEPSASMSLSYLCSWRHIMIYQYEFQN